MTETSNPLSDKAERFAWWTLVTLVAAVPLALGALGPRLALGTWDAFGLPKAAAIIVLASAAGGALAVVLLVGGRLHWHRALWLALAAALAAVVSTVTSVSPALSVFGEYMRNDGLVAFIAQVLVLVIAVQLVRSARRLRTLSVAACAAGSLVSLYALLQLADVDPLAWPTGGFGDRIFATYGNPDMLGAYLVFPFVLSLGLAFSSEKTRDIILSWVAAGLIGAALLMSLVRGAWIAALLGVVVLAAALVLGGIRARSLDLGLGGGLVAAFIGLALVVSEQAGLSVVERLATIARLDAGGSLATRLLLWRGGAAAWQDRPLFGWGPDTFQRAFARHATAGYYRQVSQGVLSDNAHNYVAQLLVTLGAVGALLVIGLLGWALVASARNAFARQLPRNRVLFVSWWAALLACLVAMMTAVSVPAVAVWAWLAAGVLLAPHAREAVLRKPAAVMVAVMMVVAAAALSLLTFSWTVADAIAATAMRTSDPIGRALALERAIAVNPLPQRYHILRADAYNQAVVDAAQTMEAPSDLEPLFVQASDAFAEAARRDPTDLESRIQLAAGSNQAARLFESADYSREAVDSAREAVRLAPRDPDALVQLSTAYLGVKDLAQAVLLAEKAVATDPAYVPGWLALAVANENRGDNRAALTAYEKALELSPRDPQARDGVRRLQSGD